MFGAGYLTMTWLFGAALAGALFGILVAGRTGRASRAGQDLEDRERRIRALEADLRVAQRSQEDLRRERDALKESEKVAVAEAASLKEAADAREKRIRQLKAELQHECGKTARLRQELAERAEEMVRTSVNLRDAQTELSVARVGSDVILEQIARLEQERSDLSALVEGLRREMALLTDASGSQVGLQSQGQGNLR